MRAADDSASTKFTSGLSRAGSLSQVVGLLCVAGLVLLSVSKDIVVARMLQRADPISLLAVFFGLVAAIFSCLCLRKIPRMLRLLRSNSRLVLAVNVTSAGSWFGFFYALRAFEPAVAIALVNSVGPVVTLVLEQTMRRAKGSCHSDYLSAAGIAAGMVLLGLGTAAGSTGIGIVGTADVVLGGIMAFICGISMAFNTVVSKKLNNAGWSAGDIMTVRFWLLLALAIGMAAPGRIASLVTGDSLMVVLGIAMAGVVLPLYLVQLGIRRVEPFVVALVLTMAPLLALAFQMLDNRLAFSWISATGIAICTTFAIYGTYNRTKHVRSET